MNEGKHTHQYMGYTITKLPLGGVTYRKPGEIGHTAKTLTQAYGDIQRRVKGAPRSTGQVLPEEQATNRLWRDWARKKAREGDGE